MTLFSCIRFRAKQRIEKHNWLHINFLPKFTEKTKVLHSCSKSTNTVLVFICLALGGWNGSKTIFRACHSKTCKDLFGEYNEPGIVRQYEYRPFWIEYIKGVVTVGKGGQQMAFSQWDAGAYHGRVTSKVYVGISGGQNAPDAWVFNTKYVCEQMQNFV